MMSSEGTTMTKFVTLLPILLSISSPSYHVKAFPSLIFSKTKTSSITNPSFLTKRTTRTNRIGNSNPLLTSRSVSSTHLQSYNAIIPGDDDDDEEDEEEDEEDDPYSQLASSEFVEPDNNPALPSSSTPSESSTTIRSATGVDWGGALTKLRDRVEDISTGRSGTVSNAMFRTMTSESPNEAISRFVQDANPEVVAAMSGAVNSLLGGLSNPAMGVEMIVKASGEKLGNLCFQLQMTGYMFRNAEYVVAIKDMMNIKLTASVAEYKEAFDRLDTDGSGFIEIDEVEALLSDVYNDGDEEDAQPLPSYEVEAFLKFFDSNKDGKISWEEFEEGLGVMSKKTAAKAVKRSGMKGIAALPPPVASDDDEEEDDDDYDDILGEPNVSGEIEVVLDSGKVMKVQAKEYIDQLKKEAEELKKALGRELGVSQPQPGTPGAAGPGGIPGMSSGPADGSTQGNIIRYISSLKGDLTSLTEGISPDVLEAMKLLIKFVLDGRGRTTSGGAAAGAVDDKDVEMEIPGSALQQLAFWQLVLGYRLREAEATGEYRKIQEN